MSRQVWAFLGIAFGISWTIWLAAHKLGAGPGTGEYILAFGSAGPAVAAILLSRTREPDSNGPRFSRLVCFAIVWPFAWFVYLANDIFRGIHPSSAIYRVVVGLLALIPAWIVSGAYSRNSGVRQLLRTLLPRQFLWPCVGLLFFPAILLIPAAVMRLLGGTLAIPPHRDPTWAYISQAAVFFFTALLFTAVCEEPGWRGYLLPQLQKKFSPLLASLLVWLPWSLWHAPLDFTGGIGRSLATYVQVRVVFFIPIAIILTWLYNRSGESLLSVALFHAGMNTFPFVLPYAPKMLGLIFVWAVAVIFWERMWRRPERTAASQAVPQTLEIAR